MYLAHAFQRPLEKDFVVVQWDRAGAGKSLAAATERPLTVSKTLADTFELTRMLRQRFDQDRVYLVGHSWGSYLGLLAIREHPEYYRAFVGTGVLAGTREEADRLRRAWLEGYAHSSGDSELQSRLSSGGRVSESDVWRYGGELYGATDYWPLLATGLAAPEYTLWDALAVRKGTQLVAERMAYDVVPSPLEGEIERLGVPVAFFLGRHDYNTPSRLASDYLDRLEAPFKRLCWFESSAHFPFFSQPEEFHRQLLFLHRELSRS